MRDDATPLLNGDRDALGSYIRHMADMMALRDWEFRISDDPPDPNQDDDLPSSSKAAQVEVTYGRRVARLFFANDWSTWEPGELRQTVAHELIHCHQEPMRWSLNNVKHVVSPPMMAVLYAAFTDGLELATDAIATAWADSLPMPVMADEEGAAE
jgi:hypothetical protein